MTEWRRQLRFACTLLATLAAASAAEAQNLLANGDFDAASGLADWTWGPGGVVLGADSGSCALSGAADASSGATPSNQFFAMYSTQCIEVDPLVTPTLHVAATYRTTAPVYARLHLQSFTDSACATFEGYYFGASGPTSAAWTAIGGTVTLGPNTRSFVVAADFNPVAAGTPPFTGSFDDIYVGVAPRLFVDGFEAESGSACPWSNIVN